MEPPQNTPQTKNDNEDTKKQLPKTTTIYGVELVQHQDVWCSSLFMKSILSFQAHFQAQPTDLLIAGMPKTGNTWLKSLVFATVHRHNHPINITNHPLLHHNPHDLIPGLEIRVYRTDPKPDIDKALLYHSIPRILATHLPMHALPQSVHDSGCKTIYICRNPMDAFVSSYFFYKGIYYNNFSTGDHTFPTIEEFFEIYIQGLVSYGPFFEHVLGFWKRHVEMPDKVLFLKYEELLKDTPLQLKRIAEFSGHPFSMEEEESGIIAEIVKLCSFNNLKEAKVNKEGRAKYVENHMFFRKGEVGDWINHLTPSMVQRMREVMHQKFDKFGLSIEIN